jgi:hypothetical protein
MERHRDDDRTGQPGPITRRLDSEFAGKDGTTLLEGSRTEEEHPEIDPQSPREQATKLKAEVSEGRGPLEKAKRALEEIDRDVSGEYERREDPTAPGDDQPERRR